MNSTDKLSLWGAALTAARDAERAAAQESGAPYDQLRRKARALREHADRLHREVYLELGPVRGADRGGPRS